MWLNIFDISGVSVRTSILSSNQLPNQFYRQESIIELYHQHAFQICHTSPSYPKKTCCEKGHDLPLSLNTFFCPTLLILEWCAVVKVSHILKAGKSNLRYCFNTSLLKMDNRWRPIEDARKKFYSLSVNKIGINSPISTVRRQPFTHKTLWETFIMII